MRSFQPLPSAAINEERLELVNMSAAAISRVKSAGVINRLDVSAFVIPTDSPEADGTLAWNKTTLVVVDVFAGDRRGLGYTYADTGTAQVIKDSLAQVVAGLDA